MKNKSEEIILRAIHKAISYGWQAEISDDWLRYGVVEINLKYDFTESPPTFIFNHDFAKALWPKKEMEGLSAIINNETTYKNIKRDDNYKLVIGWEFDMMATEAYLGRWQRHLVLMVLSDDPIKYLGENI